MSFRRRLLCGSARLFSPPTPDETAVMLTPNLFFFPAGIFGPQQRRLDNLAGTRPRQPLRSGPGGAEGLMKSWAAATGKLLIWLCSSTGTFPSSRIVDGFRGKTVAKDMNSNETKLWTLKKKLYSFFSLHWDVCKGNWPFCFRRPLRHFYRVCMWVRVF